MVRTHFHDMHDKYVYIYIYTTISRKVDAFSERLCFLEVTKRKITLQKLVELAEF